MYDVKVDWGGSGLAVALILKETGVPEHFYGLGDQCGHELELFVGVMARKITELETELDAEKLEFLAYRMNHDQYDN